MRASIGRRLAATVAIAVGVSAVVTSGVSLDQQFGRYVQSRRDMLLATGGAFSAAISGPMADGDRDGVFAALRGIGEVPHLSNATARDRSGTIIGQLGYGAHLDRDPILGAGDATSVWSLLRSRSISVVTPVVDGGTKVGELQLVSDTGDIVEGLLATLGANMAGAGVALLAGLLVAIRLQRSITRPLTDLTVTMRHVQERHDYDMVLPPQDGHEVGTLIDGFNAMLSDIRERDLRLVRHRDRLEQDVADRTRDLQSAMTAAEEANAAKSTFLATMSHEIRTPMTGLLVMAELLASSDLPGQSRRYADVISKSGSALLAIINDILDFSKIEAGKLETERVPVDVRDVVETVVNLFYARAREKGLDLAASFAADVPLRIEGDPVRLQQVVGNLVNNALKFTQAGSVSIDVFLEGDSLSIAVKDTGIGIPADKLGRIFEAFSQADGSTTRQFGGTGLGLSIASRLSQAMRGRIEVRSDVGQGSTFTCSLSLSVVEAARAWPRLTDGAANQAVVDVRAPATAHTLSAALRRTGYVVSMGPGSNVGVDVALQVVDAPRASSMQGHRPGTIIIGLVEPDIEDLTTLSTQVDLVLHQPLLEADLRAALKSVAGREPLPVFKVTDGATAQRRYDGAKILVVDDTAVNREVMVEALRRFGIAPDLATNGLEAIAAATRTSYDLIYMDGSMPELDGFEACRRLRALEVGSRRTPVLALTAHVVGVASDAWRDAGMDGVLHKPFTVAELRKSLAAHLDCGVLGEPAAVVLDKRHTAVDVDTLFDEGVLAEIASVSEASGQDFARRVFQLFIEHAPQTLNSARVAWAERDQEAVARAAHALKSMSFNIGARRVGGCANRVETSARGDGIAHEDIAALDKAVSDTVHSLSDRLAAMDSKLLQSA